MGTSMSLSLDNQSAAPRVFRICAAVSLPDLHYHYGELRVDFPAEYKSSEMVRLSPPDTRALLLYSSARGR